MATLHARYYDDDRNLVIHLSDKPISREVSQNWNTPISYAQDGSAVGIVFPDAKANGLITSWTPPINGKLLRMALLRDVSALNSLHGTV